MMCEICNRSMENEKILSQHKKNIHDPEKYSIQENATLTCNECSASFKYIGNLRRHIVNQHLDKSNKISTLRDQCIVEWKDEEFEKNDESDHCDELITSTKSGPSTSQENCDDRTESVYVDNHLNSEEREKVQSTSRKHKKVKSKLSVNQTTLENSIKREMKASKKECAEEKHDANSEVEKEMKPKEFKCDICEKILGKTSIRNHMKYIHSDNLTYHPCGVCDKIFKSGNALKRHIGEVHLIQEIEEKIECDICFKVMSSRRYMWMHKKYIHSGKTFDCAECGKVFKQEMSLKRHNKEYHSGELIQKEACDICGKLLSSKRLVKSHKNFVHCIQTDSKDCVHCGKTFYNDFKLNIHIKTVHTDYLVRVCEICGANVKNLYAHMKHVHADSTPAKCKICRETFINFKEMSKHKKSHAPRSEYICEKCGKPFKDKNNFKRHVESHV